MAKKPLTRPRRWEDAVASAQIALAAIDTGLDDLAAALDELRELQEEYSNWQDNLPDGLRDGTIGDKLQAIVDLDIPEDPRERSYEDLEGVVGDAENIDLPKGFGRD